MRYITEFALIGIGLAMDAFAVSICKGLGMKKINWGQTLLIGLFFGGFQAGMPFAGWLLGSRFSGVIDSFDHWIAFLLLAAIGVKMIIEAFGEEEAIKEGVSIRELFALAVATSIDALAVGVTFALLSYPILEGIIIIGIITFILSIIGVLIGNRFGNRYQQKAQIAGGIILILIGLRILLSGLGLIA